MNSKIKTRTKIYLLTLAGLITLMGLAVIGQTQTHKAGQEKPTRGQTQTSETQAAMTREKAFKLLREGNQRLVENVSINRDLIGQVHETADKQYPYAAILACQDSRTSSELMFDQNIGDSFSIRIAGNIVNNDILGGLEFATEVTGSKLVAVIGHTGCGAITGAIDDVKLGNLTGLLARIKPAIDRVPQSVQPRTSKNPVFVDLVTKANVLESIKQICTGSPIVRKLVNDKKVGLVGGIYDLSNGKVTYLDYQKDDPFHPCPRQ